MADKVTYNYYLGRKAMFDSDLSLCLFFFAFVIEKRLILENMCLY